MLDHYFEFLKRAELPEEAANYLAEAAHALIPAYETELQSAIDALYRGGIAATEPGRNRIAEKSGMNIYTVNLVFLVCASERMLADFRKNAIGDDIFWDTIMDIKFKAYECKNVKGVWGNFVEFWYEDFFKLNLFKLGRLEFQRSVYQGDEEYRFGDITVKKGDRIFGVHIPSCGSLAKELRMDSYKRAYRFFHGELSGGPLILTCHSWLLYGDNRKIFPAHLNMVDFMNDWDLVMSETTEKFDDAWRIFGMDYDGDVSRLPQETTQQRAMAKWLAAGGKTGVGMGFIIFDGEKIINKR